MHKAVTKETNIKSDEVDTNNSSLSQSVKNQGVLSKFVPLTMHCWGGGGLHRLRRRLLNQPSTSSFAKYITNSGITTTNLSSIEQEAKELTQHAENVHDTRSIRFFNVKQIRNAETFRK